MRLIDADALMKRLDMAESCEDCPSVCSAGFCSNHKKAGEICQAIEEAPTVDAVQVVRCKDCKHYLDGGCGNVDSQSPSKKLMSVKPDWYCADGERR